MKPWQVEFISAAEKDMANLDRSQRLQVGKAIHKVSQNPLPQSEGGYGKPLGNKQSNNLTGLLKIKLLKLGIRVVYKLVRTDEIMRIIVVAVRADDEVYDTNPDFNALYLQSKRKRALRSFSFGKTDPSGRPVSSGFDLALCFLRYSAFQSGMSMRNHIYFCECNLTRYNDCR